MPQPVNYICTKCDFRDSSFSTWGHYSYSVHDKLIPINRSIAICYTCESVVSAEILPSKERIHSLKNKTSDYLKQRFPGTESLRIKRTLEEEARFEILQDRTSPARCLACGSHDFELIPEVVPDIKRKKSGLPIRTGLFGSLTKVGEYWLDFLIIGDGKRIFTHDPTRRVIGSFRHYRY